MPGYYSAVTRRLLPGESALLGLLRIRPMHGYEMARYFERDDLADVCPIEQSLLYTYLRNLEVRGLIAWSEERVGLRPPRKRYELTPAGREAVDAWLSEPAERLRDVRLEFLVKVYVLHHVDSAAERSLVLRQVETCEAYRARLAERLSRAGSDFARLVAGSKLSAAEATIRWLRDYQASLLGSAVAGSLRAGT